MTRSMQLIRDIGYTLETVPGEEVRFLLQTALWRCHLREMLETLTQNRPDLADDIRKVGKEWL